MSHPYRGIHVASVSRHSCHIRIATFMSHPYRGIHVASVSRHSCRIRIATFMSHPSCRAQGMLMPEEIVSYHRKLPPIQPAHALYFITFRLANTIPRSVLLELVEQRKNEEHLFQQQLKGVKLQDALYRLHKRYFGHYDAWLDRCSHGERWLADVKVASIVAEEIHRGDRKKL